MDLVGLLSSRVGGRMFIPFSTASGRLTRGRVRCQGVGQPCHPERSVRVIPSAARDLARKFPEPGDKVPRCTRDDRQVDEYVVVHNNTSMKRAALPVILLNTVRSTGATG